VEDKTTHPMSNTSRITFFLFLLLLIGRISETLYLLWNPEVVSVPRWWYFSYLIAGYFLVSAVIYANRGDLRSLNIDRNFIYIFIFTGLVYALVFPAGLGVILGLCVIFDFVVFVSGSLNFEEYSPNYWQILIFMLVCLVPDLLTFMSSGKYPNAQNLAATLTAMYVANPALVIFEEIIYRGMLWSFLKKAGMTEPVILVAQAAAFWITHVNYYLRDPLGFWLTVPFGAIMFGLIVWRSKTVTFSTITHYLYDLLLVLSH